MIPNSEGSVYSLNNTNQKAVLSPGTLIGQYSIVEENCQEGFYKTVPYRFMICSGSGQWEPSVNDKLCLSKYVLYVKQTIYVISRERIYVP